MTRVYVHLIGGLGNQMFQYAAARAVTLRNDADLILDTTRTPMKGGGGGIIIRPSLSVISRSPAASETPPIFHRAGTDRFVIQSGE